MTPSSPGETKQAVDADSLLARCEAGVSAIAAAARRNVLALLPRVNEEADPAANLIGYGYGRGYGNLICTMILSKKGVKLGFYRGADLPDPLRLLEGSGKVHRYVALDSPEAAERPGLKELILAAAAAHRARKGARSAPPSA